MVVCLNLTRQAFKSVIQGRLMSTVQSDGLKWNILGSLLVERKPVLSQQMNLIEKEFANLLEKREFEKSLLNDHELRHLEDVRRNQRIKASEVSDSDLEASIQSAQDFEDLCNEELSRFEPATRITQADETNDLRSVNRRLDRHLTLLVKARHSSEWEFPTCVWESGETLRQTSERSLTASVGSSLKVRILGNAPIGFFKFKYGSKLRRKEVVNEADGGKVFFFRANYLSGVPALEETGNSLDYIWATREELDKVLASKQEYLKSIKTFLIEEGITYIPSLMFSKKFPNLVST